MDEDLRQLGGIRLSDTSDVACEQGWVGDRAVDPIIPGIEVYVFGR